MSESNDIIHINWLDIDDVIIVSTDTSVYENFLQDIKGESKVRIIRYVIPGHLNFMKSHATLDIICIKNSIFYEIANRKMLNKILYAKLSGGKIDGEDFILAYKRFHRNEIINKIL